LIVRFCSIPELSFGKVQFLSVKLGKDDFGIRLYCILLREDLVLLLNGNVKTKHDPIQCPLVNQHFKNAKSLARVLFKASADGFIRFTEKGIEIDDDFQIEI
jgi:hypothetical protein